MIRKFASLLTRNRGRRSFARSKNFTSAISGRDDSEIDTFAEALLTAWPSRAPKEQSYRPNQEMR